MSKSNFYIPVVKGSIIKPSEVHKLAFILRKNNTYGVVLNGKDLGSGLTPAALVDKIKAVYPDVVLGTDYNESNVSITFNGTDDGYTISSIMFKEQVDLSYVADKRISTLKADYRNAILLPNTTLTDIVVKNNWGGYTIIENAKVNYMTMSARHSRPMSPQFMILDGVPQTYDTIVDSPKLFEELLTKFELSGSTNDIDYDTFTTGVNESNFGKVINHFEYVGAVSTDIVLNGAGSLGKKFLLKNVEFVAGEYEDIGGTIIDVEYLEDDTRVLYIEVNGCVHSSYSLDSLNDSIDGYGSGLFYLLTEYVQDTGEEKNIGMRYSVGGSHFSDTTHRIASMNLSFNKPVKFKVGRMEPFVSDSLKLENKMIFIPRVITQFEIYVGQEAEWIEIVVYRPDVLSTWILNDKYQTSSSYGDDGSWQQDSQVEGVTNNEQMLKHVLSGLTNVTYRKDGSNLVARVEGTPEGQLLPRFKTIGEYGGSDQFEATTNNGSTDKDVGQLDTYSIRLVKA